MKPGKAIRILKERCESLFVMIQPFEENVGHPAHRYRAEIAAIREALVAMGVPVEELPMSPLPLPPMWREEKMAKLAEKEFFSRIAKTQEDQC